MEEDDKMQVDGAETEQASTLSAMDVDGGLSNEDEAALQTENRISRQEIGEEEDMPRGLESTRLVVQNGKVAEPPRKKKKVAVEPVWREGLVYTIIVKDKLQPTNKIVSATDFTGFIGALRGILADHECIYDDHEDTNISPSKTHPVGLLSKTRADQQPARWIEVKLQVVEKDNETTTSKASTTLVMRDDNVDVMGFSNDNGHWYELGYWEMLPSAYQSKLQLWGNSYRSILAVENEDKVMESLNSANLGKTFAMNAVRVLSRFPDKVDGLQMTARLAVVGLMFMVCESAKMIPVHDAITRGWDSGEGFTNQLMTESVWKYEDMSRRLRRWKKKKYEEPKPDSELAALYLVLNEEYTTVDVGRSYPGMSKAEVTVKMWLKEGSSPLVCSKISTLIGGVRVGCKPFKRAEGTTGPRSLELASYEVAVPCGKEPHLEVDLLVGAAPNQLVRILEILKFANETWHHEVDGHQIEVDIKWNRAAKLQVTGEQDYIISNPHQPRRPVEVKMGSDHVTVVYAIGDAMSFKEFVMVIRRNLADHPDREDILDRHSNFLNLSCTREHPLLARVHAEEPFKWLHIKLQVKKEEEEEEEKQWPSTTLLVRADNMYVCGFENQNGDRYKLIDSQQAASPLPGNGNIEIQWKVSYGSLFLGSQSGDNSEQVLQKLRNDEKKLGYTFAVEAVEKLSNFRHHPAEDQADARIALGGLIMMICESARMNPLRDAFARDWKTGLTDTDVIKNYVWKYYGKTSRALREWKIGNYADNPEFDHSKELKIIYLVKNYCPGVFGSRKTGGSGGKRGGGVGGRGGGGSGGKGGGGSGGSGSSSSTDSGGKRGGGDGGSGGGGNGTDNRSNESRQDGGNTSGGGDAHKSATSTEGGGNVEDSKKHNKVHDDSQGNGRPLVELLSLSADLGVIGRTITVFDGKRGQIIYRRNEEEGSEKGRMVDLVLTGPYTRIKAAFGCFAIRIDTPSPTTAPIKWEWDCYDQDYADQVDGPPRTHTFYSPAANNGELQKVAEVKYAVMSNAREATVQVRLRPKDGPRPGRFITGEIMAVIEYFKKDKNKEEDEDEHKSVLFSRAEGKGQTFPTTNDNPWFLVELARNVVAVPCGSALDIVVNLQIETDDGKQVPLNVPLSFENGISSSKTGNSKEVEVQVEVTWYPEIPRPEETLEETDQPKLKLPAETGMAGHQHNELPYTIGDELSFTKFIRNGREEYDLLPFAYPEMLKVSFPDMFKVVSMATVWVNLRPLGDGWQHMESVCGKISALIRDKPRNSAYFRVGSMLFTRTHTEGNRLRSNPMVLKLARSVVAVPSGWVLHIEVNLDITSKTSNGKKETKHLNVITLDFDNDNESRSERKGTYEGVQVEVKITRNDQHQDFPLQLTCPVEVKMESGYLTVVYTIGDEMSFTEFIMALRRILADHPDREELLDGHDLLNLSSSREHPVLTRQRSRQPARWLRIKLQVVEGSETWSTTLIMRDDNLYVQGFINKDGVCYELRDVKQQQNPSNTTIIIPSNFNPQKLYWGVSYRSILDNNDPVATLAGRPLGYHFARDAVRRLSSSLDPDDTETAGPMSARLALAGLILMVCESARMNPVLDLFVQRWMNGATLTKYFMNLYVWDYGNMSGDLLRWKSRRYAKWHPVEELQAIYLVLRTTKARGRPRRMLSRGNPGSGGGPPGPSHHGGGGSNGDTSGGNPGNGGGPPGPSHHTSGHKRERPDNAGPLSNKRNKHDNAGSSGKSEEARDAASGGGHGGDSEHASAADSERSPGSQSEFTDAGRTGGSEEARDDSGSGGDNSGGQPGEGDNDDDGEGDNDDDDPQFLGRPRVELLSMSANLGAIGKNITVFDGKRGQIIYTKEDQEQGGLADLELTGPYTGISASGCFAIVIDIDAGGSIQWEWDCFDPDDAKQVDGPPVKRDIEAQDGSKVAVVTYAVMSNAREVTVKQVKLRVKDWPSHGGIFGEISALNDDFEDKDEHRSVLFMRAKGKGQRFSTTSHNSWFPLKLPRNVIAVPCHSKLHIVMKLRIETDDGKEVELSEVRFSFDNGICWTPPDDGKQVEVEVAWYPEIARPSHPREPTTAIEEADREKSIAAPSSQQKSGTPEMEMHTSQSSDQSQKTSKEIGEQESISTPPERSQLAQVETSEEISQQKPDATLQEPSHQVEKKVVTKMGLHGVLSVSHSSHSTSEGASSIMPVPLTLVNSVGWGISILGWVISPIISKLVNKGLSYLDDVPAGSSANNLQNLEEKIEHLKRMLEAARVNPDDEKKLERWVKKLKSAFYDAEDILDAIDYHRLKCKAMLRRQSEKAIANKSFKLPPGSKDKLRETLEKIEELINDGEKLLPLVRFTTSGDNITSSPQQTTGPGSLSKTTSEPPKVFGRDKDTEDIISMLHDTTADHSVVGIYGISGSGKTTLAQYVCECVKKKNSGVPYFELTMWIHVTKMFSVDTVYHEMLEIASGKKMDRLSNLDMLQSELKKNMKGKKFLLVLDDVWYPESVTEQGNLKKLLSPLEAADKGSRVLVTSRTANVAQLLGAQNTMLISDIDEEEFFKMFMHYALDKSPVRDQDKGKFETIGREISLLLRKSPLAARTVAGQLRIRTRRAEDIGFWIDTLNRKCDLLNDTMGALWWSYHQLEEHVRQCFAYCSMFPRRYELTRNELVKMWMAQGFVDTSKDFDMEVAARKCFEVLLSTSFIQLRPNSDDDDDEFDDDKEYYTVHDLLHDLAGIVAGSDCFRIDKDMVNHQIPQDVRHLFIDSDTNLGKFMEQIVKLDNLRTLVMSKNLAKAITAKTFERMLKDLKKLRFVYVRLEEVQASVIPKCIGELKHLRYLGLDFIFFSGTTYLPPAFAKLYHLQVLYIGTTSVRCLDSSHVTDLENLRRIECSTVSIPDIGRMRWLQTLGSFTVKKQEGYEITQLENLNNIRGTLRISGLGNIQSKEDAHRANLRSKLYVSRLTLDWEQEFEEAGSSSRKKQKTAAGHHPQVVTPEPEEILEALHPPTLLAELSIWNYSGSTLPSWLSGKDGELNHLESLSFGYCRSCSQFKFSESLRNKLRSLHIHKCSWDALPDNNKLPPSLEKLEIGICPKILSLPELPSSLMKLRIVYCPDISTLPELPASLEEFVIISCKNIQPPPGLPSSLKKLQIKDCPNIKTLPELPPSLEKLQCEQYLADSYPDRQAIDRTKVDYLDDLDSETDDDLDSETDDDLDSETDDDLDSETDDDLDSETDDSME